MPRAEGQPGTAAAALQKRVAGARRHVELTCAGCCCLQCSFFEHQGKKIMYRRYASLFFIVGTTDEVRRAFRLARREGRRAAQLPRAETRDTRSLPPRTQPHTQPQSTARGLPGGVRALCPQNELAILEFIHSFVETLDRYFENVCELDIMKNLEAVHFMLNEMVMNGCIVETNKQNIMAPIMLMDKYTAKGR
jgi:hypothetical protein